MNRPLAFVTVNSLLAAPFVAAAPLGLFKGPLDVGVLSRSTIASYDAATATYTISASGDNMWAQRDAFGFVARQASGDLSLTADISLLGNSAQGHRKAALMFRQSLAPDSAYVDVAVHGDGLASLQFRSASGAVTREIQCPVHAPKRVRLEKRGDYVLLAVAGSDGGLTPSGCAIRVALEGTFYVGLAVCAHDNTAFETATFSRVELGEAAAPVGGRTSALEIIPLASLDRRVVYRSAERIESPHFSRDGSSVFFNSGGRIRRLNLAEAETPEPVDTGFATQCTAAHGLSPDGTTLVVTDVSQTRQRVLYTVPVAGGVPTRINVPSPATWRSWSPDGQTLAYSAERDGNVDIFTTPLGGGVENRLTTAEARDDGADYTADGQWIYFHSDRAEHFQIWRMHTDGSSQQQVTNDAFLNWFPHPSPDGKSIVFLSGTTAAVDGRPAEGDYFLRQYTIESGEIRELARFYGGPGTLDVPSWSPDGSRLAYVSYEPAR